MAFSCEILADSRNIATGNRLTTFRVSYPLIVHAEFCRHRSISRSVSSNRAIPTKKVIDSVELDPFVPGYFGANKAGMQSDEELALPALEFANSRWHSAMKNAIFSAKSLSQEMELVYGESVHKQIVNRLLSPFQWVNEVITMTDTDNLYAQRIDGAAERNIRRIVSMMYDAQKRNIPTPLNPGDWHIPYIGVHERELALPVRLKVSSARCARTSYQSSATGRVSTVEEDLALYDRLMGGNPKHVSPTEHQAVADKVDIVQTPIWELDELGNSVYVETVEHQRYYGPLQGFISFRYHHRGHTVRHYAPD